MAKRTKTESLATRRSKYEIDRSEAHAASQAASNKRRIDRSAPRREDMNRAAYYALLMFYEEAADEDRAGFRDPFINVLVRAGYSREASEASFDRHVGTLFNDLDAWLAQRWYAEEQRLGDRRGRYVSLKQGEKDSEVVRSKALSAFLNARQPTAGTSAADKK